MVDYKKFDGVGDPLSFIFEKTNANVAWMELIVSFVAIVAITTVLLVFQMGQPRIWYAMSRDGLMPARFQKVHPKYKTPSYANYCYRNCVGIPILFTDKTLSLTLRVSELFSHSYWYVQECLVLPAKEKIKGRFHLPYVNGKIIFPVIFIGGLLAFYKWQPEFFDNLMNWSDPKEGEFRASIFFFIIINLILCVVAFIKNLSLIPLIGLLLFIPSYWNEP
jgi:amino acid transporter